MANYNNLIADIEEHISSNGTQAINGAVMQVALKNMISKLGTAFQFGGQVQPADAFPFDADARIVFLACTPGTYTNFGGLVVADGEVAIITYDGSWTKVAVEVTTKAEFESTASAINAELSKLGQKVNGIHNYTDGGYIASNNVVVPVEGLSYSDYIPVTAGTSITAVYGTISQGGMCFVFVDDNNIFVDYYSQQTNKTQRELTVPNGATKFRFAFATGYNAKVYDNNSVVVWQALVNGIEDRVEDLEDDLTALKSGGVDYSCLNTSLQGEIDKIDEYEPIVNKFKLEVGLNKFDASDGDVAIGYYLNTNGNLSESDDYNTSGFIPVEEGTKYYQSKDGGHKFRFVAYYNTSKTFISRDGECDSFIVPSGTKYVRVTFYALYYNKAQVADEYANYSPYELTPSITGQMGVDKDSIVKKGYVDSLNNGNILFGKKWAVLGDSFTAGATENTIDSGRYAGQKKVYPYFIGNRNNMDILSTFFASGRTLAFPATPGVFTNSVCNPSAACYYQNIPADVDYITFYLGINDSHHAPGSGGGDGEDNTGEIPIGTISDNTTATYYGAWNVVLSWLIENRPFAHIGIIVSNGCDTADYRTAQIAIARKYGIPFIDLNGDDRTPCMIRSKNENIALAIRDLRTEKQSVDYDGSQTGTVNLHPNDAAHEYESTFIEDFLRTI